MGEGAAQQRLRKNWGRVKSTVLENKIKAYAPVEGSGCVELMSSAYASVVKGSVPHAMVSYLTM